MSDDKISITTDKPSVASFEDFDVKNGKGGLSRDEYKAATFRNSSTEGGDASFNAKAELLGTSGSELLATETKGETNVEKKMEGRGN